MTQPINEYVGPDGDTVGAYPGTEQDKVYRNSPDYEAVGKSAATEEETTKGESSDDLDGLSRDELNALAAEKGVEEPETLPNKDAVKQAISETTKGE